MRQQEQSASRLGGASRKVFRHCLVVVAGSLAAATLIASQAFAVEGTPQNFNQPKPKNVFQEPSGITSEQDVTQNHHGKNSGYISKHNPGNKNQGVTLQKGGEQQGNQLSSWESQLNNDTKTKHHKHPKHPNPNTTNGATTLNGQKPKYVLGGGLKQNQGLNQGNGHPSWEQEVGAATLMQKAGGSSHLNKGR